MLQPQESFLCSICQKHESDVSPDQFVATRKGHVFHLNGCLKVWINAGHTKCPLCDEIVDLNALIQLEGIDPSTSNEVTVGNSTGRTVRNRRAAKNVPISLRHPDRIFQIILLGDPGVGKSSLLQRYTDDVHNPATASTIGFNVAVKTIMIGDSVIKLNIWDSCGEERFNETSKPLLRNAHGVMLTYSYGQERTSLDSLTAWKEFVQSDGLPGAAVVLVGNKADIPESQRSIKTEEGLSFARENDFPFYETSAMENHNVDAAFLAVAVEIMQRIEGNRLQYSNTKLRRIRTPFVEQERNSRRRTVMRSLRSCYEGVYTACLVTTMGIMHRFEGDRPQFRITRRRRIQTSYVPIEETSRRRTVMGMLRSCWQGVKE